MQQVVLNTSVVEVVKDLTSRTAIALWDMKQIFHLAHCEVRHTPGTYLRRA